MVFKKALILFLSFIICSTSFAQVMSGDAFIEQLQSTGELGIFDTASIEVFNNSCSSIDLTGVEDELGGFCQAVVGSPICEGVEEEDRLDCSNMNESREFDTIDFLAGCTEGLFNSARELLAFLWDAMKWVWNQVTHPVQFAQDAGEFAESAQLYLTTEYDRAYDQASPPFRAAKAVRDMAQSIGSVIMKALSDFLYQEYQEFGCMNFRARTETMCFVAGELIIPPAAALALIKRGPAAVRATSRGLRAFLNGERSAIALTRRRNLAQRALGRTDLTPDQVRRIEDAHLVGAGEVGANGGPAGVGNYTMAQLREKTRILQEAGFDSADIRRLMENEVVGISPGGLRRLFGGGASTPPPPPPRGPRLEPSGDVSTDRFREAFNSGRIDGDNQFVSFVDESGERLPGRILENNNGTLTVETLGGVRREFTPDQLDSFRVSGTSRGVFDTPPLRLEPSADASTNQFREAFNSRNITGDNEFVSIIAPNGERLAARVVDTLDDGVRVEIPGGARLEVRGADLDNVRVSGTSREFFTPSRVELPSSGDDAVDRFRDAFNRGDLAGDNQYVSVVAPNGDRVAARVIETDGRSVTVELVNGRRVNIDGDNLNDIRFSDSSLRHFDPPQRLAAADGEGSRYYNQFRQAFNRRRVTGDTEFVSFVTPSGDRVVGQITDIGRGDITVRNIDGESFRIDGDDLLEVRVSSTAREAFNVRAGDSIPAPNGVTPNNGPSVRMEITGDRNIDEFRRAYNSGRIEGDNQFVSLVYGGDRRPARVVSQVGDDVVLEVFDQSGNIRRVTLDADDLGNVRVSNSSRDFFARAPDSAPRANAPNVGGYDFSSRRLSDYRSTGGDIVEVNFNSPSLQRHLSEAMDIIERRTGIRPNPNVELTAAQRNQIYRVWLDDIVKRVESKDKSSLEAYSRGRQDMIDAGGGRADLGALLDAEVAVCRELSMFGHVLLSEYGLRSQVMNGLIGVRGGPNQGGHAWLQIYDRNSNPLEVLDSNNTKSVHPDMADYDASVIGVQMRQRSELVIPVGQ